jgi:hypothetical protein
MKLLRPISQIIGRVVPGHESSIRPVGWTRTRCFRRLDITLTAGLVMPLLLWSAGVGRAQTVDTTLWATDGVVRAVVTDGSTIYIGGDFTWVGPVIGSGVAIDTGTGAAQQPYPRVAGSVSAVAPDGSGGLYLGGDFTAVRGQPRNHLAHLDAGGGLTAWNPSANGSVRALVVNGGTVYAGGDFTSIGEKPRNYIAALDAATGAATAWNPNANATRGYGVNALAVSGGTVYAGGGFTSIGGQPRNAIAALDAATGGATGWDPNASGVVFALAVSGGTVYAGGGFTSIGGQVRVNIAAIDAATGAATAWNPSTDYCEDPRICGSPIVYALTVSGGTVYAGGSFHSIGGAPRNSIAAIDATTGYTTTWNANMPAGVVNALAVSGGTVYAGGYFTSIGGLPRNNIAALDAATAAATAWNPNTNYSVAALAVSGGAVFAGGGFTSIGAQPRNGIAALDAATGAATTWNPNVLNDLGYHPLTSGPWALAVSGGTVWAGGEFTTVGGQPRNNIAAIDAATDAATAWNPHAYNIVYALAVSGGTVYAGGSFGYIGGQPRSGIAALDAATGAATAWNPNAYGNVYALAVGGGTVYAGGAFTSIGGQPRNYIAAIDTATGAATAWDPNANNTVAALDVTGGTVYAGGEFTSIGGQPRNHIAALDAGTGAATGWAPNANGSVLALRYALTVNGGRIYAGGIFGSIGGQPRNNIAALDAASGAATAWNPNSSGDVYALAVSGGTVYAGGYFASIGGQPNSHIAAISADPIVLSVSDDPSIAEAPLTVAPNPTRAAMQIQYAVARAGRVRLELLDVSGRIVATLDDRFDAPGRHRAMWDGAGRRGRPSPGLYFIRLVAPDQAAVRKLVIIE